MGIEYGKKEIQKLLETDMFYRKDCLNYSGFLKGEKGVTYQEFIASPEFYSYKC